MYTEEFGLDPAKAGLFLGIGEALGFLVMILTDTAERMYKRQVKKMKGMNVEQKPNILQMFLSRPLHLVLVLFMLGFSTMLFSINVLILAIVSQLIMSSLNDLSVSLLNELTSSSLPAGKFKKYQSTGQWLRRIGNLITGILGPILFSFAPNLPFLVFGFALLLWTIFLWSVLYKHVKEITTKTNRMTNTSGLFSGLLHPVLLFCETFKTPLHVIEKEYFKLQCEGNIVIFIQ